MPAESEVTAIAHVIQLAIAPVFLLAGVSGLLNVLSNRLGRIIDRARKVEESLEQDEAAKNVAHSRKRLEVFSKRARLVNYAITLATACSSMVCLVVIALFAGVFLPIDLSRVVSVLFVLAMISLFSALVCFLNEILLATRNLRIGGTTRPTLPGK